MIILQGAAVSSPAENPQTKHLDRTHSIEHTGHRVETLSKSKSVEIETDRPMNVETEPLEPRPTLVARP